MGWPKEAHESLGGAREEGARGCRRAEPGYVLEHLLVGDWWELLDVKKPDRVFQSTAGMLVGQYDHCDDIGELKTALEAAGFDISY